MLNKESSLKIAGMPWPIFLFCFVVFSAGIVTGVLPDNMLVGIAFAAMGGYLLTWLGGLTKIGRTIGLPVLFCMLIPSLLVFLGVVPESVTNLMSNFMGGYNFLDMFIAALMTGSILGMDTKLLRKAIVRYMLPMLAALCAGLLIGGLIGSLLGYGFGKSILTIALPICGSGTGAGAVPMAQIFTNVIGGEPDDYLAAMVPAVTIANILCILIALVYNAVGKTPDKPFKGFSGQGELMQKDVAGMEYEGEKETRPEYDKMAVGFILSAAFYLLGTILNTYVWDAIHPYAWVCILLIAFKLSGFCPEFVQESCMSWYGFVAGWGTVPVVFATGVVYLNIQSVVDVVSDPKYFVIIVVVCIAVALTAGFVGWLLKMNFVEASITAGLCMANSGGGGDIMVLGAAERLNLIPFAQISSRIGGSIILIVASFLARILM